MSDTWATVMGLSCLPGCFRPFFLQIIIVRTGESGYLEQLESSTKYAEPNLTQMEIIGKPQGGMLKSVLLVNRSLLFTPHQTHLCSFFFCFIYVIMYCLFVFCVQLLLVFIPH